jgi:hypothetical protein
VAISIVALATALLGGCGGSDSSPLSKAELVKQGDVICKRALLKKEKAGTAALTLLTRKTSGSRSAVEAEALGLVLHPIGEMTEQLEDLDPADGQQAKFGAILSAFEREISQLEANPKAAMASESAFLKPDKLAKQYGFKSCTF